MPAFHRPRTFAVLAAVLLSAGFLAACVPPAPETIYRGAECAYSLQIQAAWADTYDGKWAVDTAIRESHCDPCAFYPGQSNCEADPRTAKGLFQLLGHDDLIGSVCPGQLHAWSDAACNIAAARLLYDGAGKAPWRL